MEQQLESKTILTTSMRFLPQYVIDKISKQCKELNIDFTIVTTEELQHKLTFESKKELTNDEIFNFGTLIGYLLK